MKIQITGASGAGKTYLGHCLSQKTGFIHIDTDDILWVWDKNIQPYTVSISEQEACEKLKHYIEGNKNLIATGLFYPWSEELIEDFDLVINLITSTKIRKQRILDREILMYGDRVSDDGDMYLQFQSFVEWACNYDSHDDKYGSKEATNNWIKKFNSPVITLDGSNSIEYNIEMIEKYINITIHKDLGDENYDNSQKIKKR